MRRGLAAVLLSLGAGALAAVAHPPFGVLPGLLGYALLLALLDRADGARPLRSAFWRGWLAGSAYFLIGTWWVAEAFLVDARNQGWMAPFAVVFLATGVGLFWGAAGLLYRWLAPNGALRLLVFAGAFALLEWLRGHVLTGFPWNLPGETWRVGSAPSQFASVVGAYGLTWITLAICASPALLLPSPLRGGVGGGGIDSMLGSGHSHPPTPSPQGGGGALAVGLAVLALAGLYGFGIARLSHTSPVPPDAPRLRIVQADVRQESKYDAAIFRSIVEKYVALTKTPSARPADVVIWPEGAIPAAANDYLAPGTWTEAAIRGALLPGQTLLVGAYRVEGPPDKPLYYNTLLALRARPDALVPVGVYDKFRLVPFGEYLPLESLMSRIGFKKLVHVGDGFSPGPRPRPMRLPGLPSVQPLICYESLFPGFVREGAIRARERPGWIVNVSNDAWFGQTSGPPQHLNIASYRAIEEGLPMVRATPTGVSAVIDGYGRIQPRAKLGLGRIGVIDTSLPPPLSPTLFARFGSIAFWLLTTLSAAAVIASKLLSRRIKNR